MLALPAVVSAAGSEGVSLLAMSLSRAPHEVGVVPMA